MRLKRHMGTLLVERNITNVKTVDSFVDDLWKRSKRKGASNNVEKWLKTVVRKWIINDLDNEDAILQVKSITKGAAWAKAAWVQAALARGEDLYSFAPTRQIANRLDHMVDWLVSDDSPKRLGRLGMKDAIAGVEAWDKKLAAMKAEGRGKTETVQDLGQGYELVKLLDQEAYKWEGNKMGHCVGSYSPEDYQGSDGVYSIRDKAGLPHVTIEVSFDEIEQIQGKENKPPAAKYTKAITNALTTYFKDAEWPETYVELKSGEVIDYRSMGRGDVAKHLSLAHLPITVPEGAAIDKLTCAQGGEIILSKHSTVGVLESLKPDRFSATSSNVKTLKLKEAVLVEIEGSNIGKIGATMSNNCDHFAVIDSNVGSANIKGPVKAETTTFSGDLSVHGDWVAMEECDAQDIWLMNVSQAMIREVKGRELRIAGRNLLDAPEVVSSKFDLVSISDARLNRAKTISMDATVARSVVFDGCVFGSDCTIDVLHAQEMIFKGCTVSKQVTITGNVDKLIVSGSKGSNGTIIAGDIKEISDRDGIVER